MNETNGAAPSAESRILSLDAAKRSRGKSGDFITRRQAEQLVQDALATELPKIHEFYLSQIPPHVSRMILDALLGFGLIKSMTADIPVSAGDSNTPLVSENAGGDAAAHDSTAPPADGDGDGDGDAAESVI